MSDTEAEALLAKTRPLSPSAAPGQNMLPPNTRRDIPGKFGPSPAWRAGTGPPTLFVHGWDDTHRVWRRFAQHFLQKQMPFLLMDLPGHGASKAENCLWPFAGQSVAEVVAAEGPVDTIIAHSFGCIATMRAIALGARADYVVLIAPPLDPARNWTARQRKEGASEAAIARAQDLFRDRTGFDIEGFDPSAAMQGFDGKLMMIGSHGDEECPVEPMQALAAGIEGAVMLEDGTLGHRELALDMHVFRQILDFLGYD
jgi:pimeloyl-ACP methyl ester carboxylesterase